MSTRFALAMLGALAFGASAHAADVYVGEEDVEVSVDVLPEPEAFSWTGIYFGVNGGFGGNKFVYPYFYDAIFLDDPITGDASITSSGFFAGGQIGGQYQAGSLVFGIEADAQWSNITGELEITNDNLGFEISAGSTINWFATIRGRVGLLATPRFLAYATGGAAVGEVESFYDLDIFADSTKGTQWGWTAGGGFEYAITDHITFKTEYLFVDLGEQNLYEDGLFSDGEFDFLSIDAITKFHTVKAGFNFLW